MPSPGTPSVSSFPEPGTQNLDPARAKALQAALAQIIKFPESPSGASGATAAVVTDHWTWSGAVGEDSRGTPLRPDTSLGISSITKTFVAAEVLRLAQEGKINLDLPISRYVRHRLTANDATVRQHLAMTSGIQDFQQSDYERLNRAVAAAPGKHWTLAQPLNYYTSTIGSPDGDYSFSNASYALLGMLIENVTGEPLAVALRRDLATPAGLRHAAFQDGEKPEPPVVGDANDACGAPDGYIPCRAFASSGAAYDGAAADAPTVARWGYQLYGGRVIPSDLVDQMTAGDGEYGLGTMRFTREFGLGDAYGHAGISPDDTSLLVVIPDKRVSIALILADGDRNIGRRMDDLTEALQPLLG
ncbi:serine hydrolase domain-containing protein [Kribbella sp. NPDC004875]|uniref:serine hydrolase domain-containing protein n=1 Tax=Kribbella sp. NPDC004875 TaxID=3364107 RepID=UPI0036CF3BC2